MQILLVNPPTPTTPKAVLDAPLGLGYMGAVLEAKGYQVCALDMAVEQSPWQMLTRILQDFAPQVVGITAVASTFGFALEIARICKECSSSILTVIGGVHVTLVDNLAALLKPTVDFIVFGEGEYAILELVQAIEQNDSVERVKGIGYRRDRQLIKTTPRPFIADLDILPLPARHLFPMHKYVQTHVMSSRGCPYHCLFCSSRDFWKGTIRFRSPTSFVEEIECIISEYGKRNIFVADDSFTLDKERVLTICNLMSGKDMDFRWSCLTRVDLVSEDLLRVMAKAGCETISFGCEAGTQEDLNRLNKEITLEQIGEAVRLTKRAGIAARTSWVFGFPWSTSESAKSIVQLIKEMLPDEVVIYTPVPYPGSRFYKNIGRFGINHETIDTSEFYSGRAYPLPIADNISAKAVQEILAQTVDDLITMGYKSLDVAQAGDKVVTTSFSPFQSSRSALNSACCMPRSLEKTEE